jgi:hypothetical protein
VPRNRVGRPGEAGPSPAAFHIFAALLLIGCLALLGCGLDTITTFFDAPSFSNSGNFFILQNNTLNTGLNFYGYNVYYRVYNSDQTTGGALDAILSAQNTSIYTPSSAFTYLTNQLGFLPLCILNSAGTAAIVPPTFFTVSNQSLATTYSIQAIPGNTTQAPNLNWYYTTVNPDNSVPTYVVRNNTVQFAPPLHDSFNSTYKYGQADYSGTSSSGQSATIFIVMFAVAYGIDPATFSTIYSFPSLGAQLTYTLPQNLNGW